MRQPLPDPAGPVAEAAAAVRTPDELAALLRDLRRRHARGRHDSPLTYRELAARTGWSQTAIAEYFTARTLPPTDRLDGLLELLGATPAEQRALATARDRVEETARRARGRGGGGPPAADGPGPAPRQLPSAPRLFTGRARELALLDAALDEHSGGICAIGGMGGIGKTWLALHWAHTRRDCFPDGELHADLRGFDPTGQPVDPAAAVRAFLAALGVAPASVPAAPEAQLALYRGLTAGRRMLVLLDNALDTAQAAPLLPGGSGCTVLVTSRRRLTGLVAAHGARPVALGELPADDAREVLARRLGRARLHAEPRAAADLVACCAGLPLALGVAAACAATHPDLPLAALAGDLRDDARRLDALDGGEPRADLRAVLSWSGRALSREAARGFGLLGTAPGPDLTPAAAAHLLDLPPPAARALLRELDHAHLVQRHAPERYRMHDLLRLHATEQARTHHPPPERRAAIRRLIDFHTEAACAAARLLAPHEPPLPPGPRPGEGAPGGPALGGWAAGEGSSGGPAPGGWAAGGTAPGGSARGEGASGGSVPGGSAFTGASPGEGAPGGSALGGRSAGGPAAGEGLSGGPVSGGRVPGGIAPGRPAGAVSDGGALDSRTLDGTSPGGGPVSGGCVPGGTAPDQDPSGGSALGGRSAGGPAAGEGLSGGPALGGRVPGGIAPGRPAEAVPDDRTSGLPAVDGSALSGPASGGCVPGGLAPGEGSSGGPALGGRLPGGTVPDRPAEAVSGDRTSGFPDVDGPASDHPAPGGEPCEVPETPLDRVSAMAWFDAEHANLVAAQQAARTYGWDGQVCRLAWALDPYHRSRGYYAEQAAAWRLAAEAAEALGVPALSARAHQMLGDACALLGRTGDALRHLDRALELTGGADDAAVRAEIHHSLGGAWERHGDDRQALEHALRALAIFRTLDDTYRQARALNAVGWLRTRLGDHAEARADCLAALALLRRHPADRRQLGESSTLDSLGCIAHRRGEHDLAVAYYGEALAICRAQGHSHLEADVLRHTAEALLARRRTDEAREALARAHELLTSQHRLADAERVGRELADLARPADG
ncbi:tetratricopeptide repeat protein [Streptomyces sp. NPDC021020]|uniref:tetratricopeptide repeat protein n=1 Tax=Streptomyces sp. NPDC021020 TaxID=3365109 RepID=UPI0037B022B9